MKVEINTILMEKTINNLVEYSFGFLDGINNGKKIFFDELGKTTIKGLNSYIDANARLDPSALHHVYEWSQTGRPSGRLFNINYIVTGGGLSLNSTFSQSKSIQQGSNVPFYNKAEIMEKGIPVTIKPKGDNPLVFEVDGETIFTKRPIINNNPGGANVAGSYEKVFDMFIKYYFTQAFLSASGLYDYLRNPRIYKDNFAQGAKGGKGIGQATGFKWIISAKGGVE
jgi:hypothetical protein